MRRLASLAPAAMLAALVVRPAAAAPFDKSGIPDWTQVPPPTAERAFAPPVAKRMRLANGMAVLVIENHRLPLVALQLLVLGAGSAADPAGKGGLAAFTADLLDESAGGLSALGIAEEQDRLGATITLFAGVDAAQLTASTLTKTLDPALDLVAKIITQPAFDDQELARVKGDRVTALELRRDRPREVASLMLAGELYGMSSPYGHPAAGVREEFNTLSAADVKAFYAEHWNPAATTLVIAGDVDPEALRAKLDARLGAWRPAGARSAGARPAARAATAAHKPAHRLLLVDRAGAAQSDVRIGLVGPVRTDKRSYQFDVMCSILGEGFTNRLNQRLREQLGITYGAGARMEWRLSPGPFVIASAIVTAETARGITEVFKIVDDLATADVPAAELEKSKQNIVRALPAEFATNAATVTAFAKLVLHGLPDDYYAGYAAEIRKVQAADVKAVAKALIPSDRMIVSVVGDMAKVRASLEPLKLGDPSVRDLYGMPIKK